MPTLLLLPKVGEPRCRPWLALPKEMPPPSLAVLPMVRRAELSAVRTSSVVAGAVVPIPTRWAWAEPTVASRNRSEPRKKMVMANAEEDARRKKNGEILPKHYLLIKKHNYICRAPVAWATEKKPLPRHQQGLSNRE